MNNINIKGKKVLIMGLGLLSGGVSTARYFAKKGALVTVTDLRSSGVLRSSIKKLSGLPIRFVLGEHKTEDFENADLIIRNPDVMPDSPYLEVARKKGIAIEMAESFFAKNCKGIIIGVTGARGKSTTATLITKILKDAGRDVVLAGNVAGIGTLDYLDKITPKTLVVLELSSFQLNGFGEAKISPHIAVITNIFPEHLNHYQSLDEYVDDKKNIFRYQTKSDYLLLNKNNIYSKDFAGEAPSKVIFFDKSKVAKWSTKLIGGHNKENIAAAFTVAQIIGIPEQTVRKTVSNFIPLAYHIEPVRTINKITFINDGVSTSPEATMAALKTFKQKVIIILGGNDKKLDFSELGKLLLRKTKAIFMMKGTATNNIKKVILDKKLVKGELDNLKDVVNAAYKFAKAGDIILFSPAATSFNWFTNTYQRSKDFENIVKSL